MFEVDVKNVTEEEEQEEQEQEQEEKKENQLWVFLIGCIFSGEVETTKFSRDTNIIYKIGSNV